MKDVMRLRYFDNEFLDAADFGVEQEYHRGMRYWHTRHFHTWGLSYTGLEVNLAEGQETGEETKVVVSPGIALDNLGREILLTGTRILDFDQPQYIGGKSYYITIYWYEQQGLPRQDNEHKRWVEVPELGTTEEFPKHPDMNLVLARVKLRENKTIESIDGSMRRYAAHEVGNKTVTSVKIVEADGTSGQDINRGDGIKTTHIQNGAVTFDKISNDVQQKFENVESAAKAYADELLVGHTHIKGDISIDGVLTGNIKKADKPSAIDLSLTNVIYLDYREANVEGNITVLNGVPGTVYYLIVKSNGIHYTFTNVKWPSGIDPIPSADGKRDMYSFICIGPDDYLGTFAFNYD